MKSSTLELQKWTERSKFQQHIISVKISEMIRCLEKDIHDIELILKYLDEIRALVLKRDDKALKTLLERAQVQAEEYKQQEAKRNLLQRELADILTCDAGQVTLSKLEYILPYELKSKIQEKRIKLTSLMNKLKREHLSTVLLLAECARFNRMVLKGIFRFGETDMLTYSSNGTARQQSDKSFMSFKL